MICGTRKLLRSNLRWNTLLLSFLVAALSLPVWAAGEKGCEGLGLNSRPPSQYTRDALEKRLERNPMDVDALINLGSLEEESENIPAAAALFDKAIRASPNCSEGYVFAGLIHERLSGQEESISEADIRKAVTLNPDLRTDGNIQSYVGSHPDLWGRRPVAQTIEEPWRPTVILARSNHLLIGFGAGLFSGTLILALVARARQVRQVT